MIGIGCSFRNANQKLGVFSPRRTGNAMAAPDRFIAWCKQEQARIEQQLELMEKGKVRTRHDTGVGWVDTTSESMERARARLADLKSSSPNLEARLFPNRMQPCSLNHRIFVEPARVCFARIFLFNRDCVRGESSLRHSVPPRPWYALAPSWSERFPGLAIEQLTRFAIPL